MTQAAEQFASLFGPPDLSVVDDATLAEPLFRCAGCRGRHPIDRQFRTESARFCEACAPADAVRSAELKIHRPGASYPLAQLARIR